jgi:hypothetical protein
MQLALKKNSIFNIDGSRSIGIDSINTLPGFDTLSSRFLPGDGLRIGDFTNLLTLFTVHVVTSLVH